MQSVGKLKKKKKSCGNSDGLRRGRGRLGRGGKGKMIDKVKVYFPAPTFQAGFKGPERPVLFSIAFVAMPFVPFSPLSLASSKWVSGLFLSPLCRL